jgi:hypothetical protein
MIRETTHNPDAITELLDEIYWSCPSPIKIIIDMINVIVKVLLFLCIILSLFIQVYLKIKRDFERCCIKNNHLF